MESISLYSDLIKEIPKDKQSTKVKRETWGKLLIDRKDIEKEIFGDSEEIELSRNDVILEEDVTKKIVKVLMWGYPTGGRGNNIPNILKRITELGKILTAVYGRNLSKDEAVERLKEFKQIKGLGVSTWSKLLLFFEVSIDSCKCQIYDLKVVNSLNKKQFSELKKEKIWKQNNDDYYEYIKLLDSLSKKMCVHPEQVEIFLFYYNLNYKF